MWWENRLQELVQELNGLGYSEYQLKQIIQETVEDVPLQLLNEEQGNCLNQVLEEYLRFGTKCNTSM